jgi:hypothetical protein
MEFGSGDERESMEELGAGAGVGTEAQPAGNSVPGTER